MSTLTISLFHYFIEDRETSLNYLRLPPNIAL